MEKTTKRGKKEKKHATKEIEIIRKEKNRQEGKKIAEKNEIVNRKRGKATLEQEEK